MTVPLREIALVATHPQRGYGDWAATRSRGLAAAIVVVTGLLAGGVSAAATLVEPVAAADRASGYAFSAILPVFFVAFWAIDAAIVDAVAQLMGATTRLRTWTVASAHAIPILLVFELVRLMQAALDQAGAVDVSTGFGFVEFAVIGWFVWVLSCGVRAVYGLPAFNAVSAALAPPAVMMTVLLVLLIVAAALHVTGVG